ncbi:MAG TPA: hypothetical protein VJ804_01375 [Acidimicrobiales bacterium]|nr:hypothetical protein [Acidimicrobiales bacterium]
MTATTNAHTVTTPDPARRRQDLPLQWLLLGTLVAYLPLAVLGYGTDVDVANVLRAGRSALDGDYEISRGPGATPHEVATAALDRVGGPFLVNLAAVGFALLAVWCVHRLLSLDGARWPGWAALVLAANPWFWLASTSLGDFTWSLALGLAGALAARRDRRVLAGVLFGLGIGCRASTVFLALAWLVAERTGAPSDRRPWRDVVRTGATTVVVGALCFVPPWLSTDRTLDFLENELEFAGWGTHLGRWAVKNLATLTIPVGIVLVAGWKHLREAVRRWRMSAVVRFAVLTIVAMEVLFFRLPFKPVHLLPVIAGTVLLVGTVRLDRRRWLLALVAAQLVAATVGTTLAAPDRGDDADTGRISLRPADGVIVNDVRCRLADLDRGDYVEGDSDAELAEATARAEANWVCQRDSWRDAPSD